MRIAVDAMGGDRAPMEIVKGAVQAANKFKTAEIILVGNEKEIGELLRSYSPRPNNIFIRHASQVVGMDEPGVAALRKKGNSSITKSVELVASGEAEALVSAGNTGATVAASTLYLKMLKGVKRPCIAATIPTRHGRCVVVDVGANLKCKPIHLLQYAVMSSVYTKYLLGVKEPRIGLLNIGQEDSKGNDLVKQVYNLLNSSPLNFVGNSEGLDIFEGKFDVVVCEGFVGNVLIKFAEGLAENLVAAIEIEASKGLRTRLGLKLLRPALRRLWNRMDYSEYGGVPLLGVDGICIISHGRSDAKAIQNAIREALELGKHHVNSHITSELEACGLPQGAVVEYSVAKEVN